MDGIELREVKSNYDEITEEPLTLAERRELADFLAKNGVMPIYALHGFLCAMASYSKVLTIDQWLPEIYQLESAVFCDDEASAKIVLIHRLYTQVLSELREKDYFYPFVDINKYGRLVTLEDAAYLTHWCEGYFTALIILEVTWDVEEDGPMGALIASLMAFAPDELLAEMPEDDENWHDLQELKDSRESIIEDLPNLVAFTYRYNMFKEHSGEDEDNPRATFFFDTNQTCPCKSGEPFKNCCGREGRSLH